VPPFADLLLRRARGWLADPMLRGIGAFGSAELANRGVRLITTVIIARQLAPNIVGEAALALTLFELVRVLGSIGVGQRIIAAHEGELAAVCNTANRLFWIWSMVLVVIQLGIAVLLHAAFGQTGAATKLAALSAVYLLMPAGLVSCYLAMRDGLNTRLARTAATQAVSDHLMTAALLLIWPDPWSIVLPKLLTTPIWLFMTRRNRPWQPDPNAGQSCWRGMVRYGGGVLAADGLTALRQQGDNLIIAATMGSSALGAYYFAYNAGLGIITALVGGFGTVSFPMLCAAPKGPARQLVLRKIVLGGTALFVPLIAAQSLLAPYYVPLIFGAHWRFAAPLIAILCLAGFGQLASILTANWLRAEGRVRTDAGRSLMSCVFALSGLYLGTLTGSLQFAVIGLVAGTVLAAGLAALHTLAPVLQRPLSSSKQEQLA
jgi:lipopolysaccharide exporter